ncbi:unnamed protein product [Sphagnum jensenii]|uniref:Uncharacterized protein n=1 Tax=Sphagnum jensenii TaxID=128206 RepID=A0ABP0W535_9BRYO
MLYRSGQAGREAEQSKATQSSQGGGRRQAAGREMLRRISLPQQAPKADENDEGGICSRQLWKNNMQSWSNVLAVG